MELKQLTEEQKQAIVEQANLELETEKQEGNTVVTSASEDDKLMEMINSFSPKELFEQNVSASYRSLAKLDAILPRLSKKNLHRLIIATLRLPEEGLNLNFGGTAQDVETAKQAFIQAQIARNASVYVLGTKAMAQARLAKKAEQKEKENQNESK
jgi:hypothetical protein